MGGARPCPAFVAMLGLAMAVTLATPATALTPARSDACFTFNGQTFCEGVRGDEPAAQRLSCRAQDAIGLTRSGTLGSTPVASEARNAWSSFTADLATGVVQRSAGGRRAVYVVQKSGDDEATLTQAAGGGGRIVFQRLSAKAGVVFLAYGGATSVVSGTCTSIWYDLPPTPPHGNPDGGDDAGGPGCFLFNGVTFCE
jgi:hypothetical protein